MADFWDQWKSTTRLEKRSIAAVRRAREYVIAALPPSRLVAIYIKGSFTRRELTRSSDVDMVPIVVHNNDADPVWEVNTKNINPVVVVPLSLTELRTNKLHSKPPLKPDLRAKPDRFLRYLGSARRIYGRAIAQKDFPIRSDKVAFQQEREIIQRGYIPAFKQKKIPLVHLIKEVFWMVELELQMRGKKVPHSFRGIINSVSDPRHLIHEAESLRVKRKIGSRERTAFLEHLKSYLRSIK